MSPIDLSHQISSSELDQSTVTAHLETEITPDKNLVYCAAFQLAWNQLIGKIVGGPLQLEGDPKIAQALNKRLVNEQAVAEDCYLAMAGFERDGIVEQVKRALEEKFNREPGFDLVLNHPDDILAYAFLAKSLPFDTEFEVLQDPLVFSDDVKVEAFGIETEDDAVEQVVILDYQHSDDFIIKLQGLPWVEDEIEWGVMPDRPRVTDDIILAKVAPQATLLETVQAVLFRSRKNARYHESSKLDFGIGEVLRIPKIDFDVHHKYTELVGKKWFNRGFEGYFITRALQNIKFKLDETGADLTSEAAMMATIGIKPPPPPPRQFIFDKPFLLCLKKNESHVPYLAMWIGNSELLVKA